MTIPHGAPAYWFLEVFLDAETLRVCNSYHDITFDGETYQGIGDQMTGPEDVDRTADLKSQKIDFEFEASRQLDNTRFIAKVLDANWRRRPVRARYAVGEAFEDFSSPIIISDETGRIENIEGPIEEGDAPILEMNIESGALIFLERRQQTRSPANQKAIFPGDTFFDKTARLDGVTLPWRTRHTRNGSNQITYEIGDEVPREMLIGRGVTKGSFVYGATTGTLRRWWAQVYALADHQCDALEKLYINGEDVLNGVTLQHGVRTPLSAFRSPDTRLWVTWYDGRADQVADPYLISATAGQSLNWTASDRGRGVCYCIVEHQWDDDNPTNFDYLFQLRGARLYDERFDTTVGGSGSQRLGDPSTWVFSTNSEVALRHFALGRVIESGNPAMWFGVGADRTFLESSAISRARADYCDDPVAKLVGTHKRFETNGWISAADDHKKNLERLADAMVSVPIDQGGRIVVRTSEPRTPVVTLTDDDLVIDEETSISLNARADDVVNRIEGRFQDAENKFAKVDYPAVSDAGFVAYDGEEITKSWNQEFEIDGERAQRNAALYLNRLRRSQELEEVFGAKAKDVTPGDWVRRESNVRGFPNGKTYIAEKVTRFQDGTVELLLLEVDPDEIIWTANMATALPGVGELVVDYDDDVIPIPSISVTPHQITGGNASVPAVIVSRLGSDIIIGTAIQGELALWDGNDINDPAPTGDVEAFLLPANSQNTIALRGIMPATGYVVRFRILNGESAGEWTEWALFQSSGQFTAGIATIADGITGQGWGATATEEEVSNALLAATIRPNLIRNPSGLLGFRYWNKSTGPWAANDHPVYGRTFNRSLANVVNETQNIFTDFVPCSPGEDYTFSFNHAFSVSDEGAGNSRGRLQFYTSGGSFISEVAPALFVNNGDPFQRLHATATAPANAAQVRILFSVNDVDGDANSFVAIWAVKLEQGDGPTAFQDPSSGSDVTQDNIAAGFEGQGPFAILTSVALGSPLLTGFGGLAGGDFVTFGSDIRASDGFTVLGDVDVVTVQGVASAIINQGAGATANTLTDLDAEAKALLAHTGTSIHINENLSVFPDGSDVPVGWVKWGGGDLTKVSRPDGTHALKMGVTAGTVNAGLQLYMTTVANKQKPGYYLAEFEIELVSGSLVGAGGYLQFRDDNDALIAAETIEFSTTPTHDGAAPGAGEVGKTYSFTKIVHANYSQLAYVKPFIMTNWVNYSDPEVAKEIIPVKASVRAATVEEIRTLGMETGADVTGNNVASGFLGQGAFATLNTVSRTSGLLTDFGGLSGSDYVTAGQNIRASNGSTILGDGDIVTSQGIASGFTGQQWGATALESQASNAKVAHGVNLLVNSRLAYNTSAQPPFVHGSHNTTGLNAVRGRNLNASYSGVENVLFMRIDGTPAVDTVADGHIPDLTAVDGTLPYLVPVSPGERLYGSFLMAAHRCYGKTFIAFYNGSGNFVSAASSADGGRQGGGVSGKPENFDRLGLFATVPSGVSFAGIFPRLHAIGGEANPYIFYCQPFLTKVDPAVTDPPPFNHTGPEPLADKTGDNIASGIENQGAGATANSLGDLDSAAASDLQQVAQDISGVYHGVIGAAARDALFGNESLSLWPVNGDYPAGFGAWSGGAPVKHTLSNGVIVPRFNNPQQFQNRGMQITDLGKIVQPGDFNGGQFSVRARYHLHSGSLGGAGLYFVATNGAGTSSPQIIPFCDTPDVLGNVPGAGVPGKTYEFEVIVDMPNDAASGYDDFKFYAMSNWVSTGGTVGQQIKEGWFEFVSVRRLSVHEAIAAVLKQAFIGPDGTAIARLVQIAAATGSTPAIIELLSAGGSSAIAFMAAQIFFGGNTRFEDANNSFITEFSDGGTAKRARFMGPFGANGDCVIWLGPASVAEDSETFANAEFALTTAGDLQAPIAQNPTLSASPSGANYTRNTGSQSATIVLTPSNFPGTGAFSYSAEILDDPNSQITVVDPLSQTPQVQVNTNLGDGLSAVRFTAYRGGASASVYYGVAVL